MNHNVTVATPHCGLLARPVQHRDVIELTEEARIVVAEEFVEMSVLIRIFVNVAILHFHVENVPLVQNH